MFDARYVAFATISALLVISPGATMAVILESALEEGRLAALHTVLGVGIGNSSLAIASALGMAIVLGRWPWALQAVRGGGAAYLAYLGLRALWGAVHATGPRLAGAAPDSGRHGEGAIHLRPGSDPSAARRAATFASSVSRGFLTNVLNPPVVLFYMTFLPQFIGPRDPFFRRFVLLGATHVSMSLVWLSIYALALGALADRLTRPSVRRTLEAVTGVVLVGLGVRLVLR